MPILEVVLWNHREFGKGATKARYLERYQMTLPTRSRNQGRIKLSSLGLNDDVENGKDISWHHDDSYKPLKDTLHAGRCASKKIKSVQIWLDQWPTFSLFIA
jgi:hypothetical protein